MDWWGYSLSGLLVGFVVGLTGVGGGSLMTPLLVMFFGVNPATAVGTDLLYAAITKSGGMWVHGKRGNVDWKICGWLAAGSVPASLVTVWVMHQIGVGGGKANSLITTTLGVALILTALALVFRTRLQKFGMLHGKDAVHSNPRKLAIATVVTGLVLGVLVTVSSIGAGALGTVALFFLYPFIPTVRIVGSDIAHAVPLTLVAGLGHLALGSVDFALLGALLVGSLPGITVGSHISGKIPDRILRPILATMLFVIGGKLVW